MLAGSYAATGGPGDAVEEPVQERGQRSGWPASAVIDKLAEENPGRRSTAYVAIEKPYLARWCPWTRRRGCT
jgi:hypothetical protein